MLRGVSGNALTFFTMVRKILRMNDRTSVDPSLSGNRAQLPWNLNGGETKKGPVSTLGTSFLWSKHKKLSWNTAFKMSSPRQIVCFSWPMFLSARVAKYETNLHSNTACWSYILVTLTNLSNAIKRAVPKYRLPIVHDSTTASKWKLNFLLSFFSLSFVL